MSVNLNLPLVNQLSGANYRPPNDGLPDNNSGWDCGEADFCSIVSYFGGPTLNPDEVKDAVLGPGAANAPSSMDSYGAQAADYGLAITAVAGDPATLLTRARAELTLGHPVVILIPSMWGEEPPPPQGVGSLHFVALEADDGANLTAMNPWGGFYQTQPYGWWQERIRDGAIWIFSKEGDASTMLDINNATVAQFFYLTPAGAWHCKQTGAEIALGMLETYRSLGPVGGTLNGLTLLGQPKGNIIYPTSGAGYQCFERGALVWDPGRKLDNPPGAQGDYYLAHLDGGPAQAFYAAALTASLRQQLSTAQTQLAQAQDALKAAQAAASAAQAQDATDKAAAGAAEAADAMDKAAASKAEADLAAAQAQVTQLESQVAQLEQQLADGQKGAAVVEAIRAALTA